MPGGKGYTVNGLARTRTLVSPSRDLATVIRGAVEHASRGHT